MNNQWLIVSNSQLEELNSINSLNPDKKCTATLTQDNVWITNSDKLNDDYWKDWHVFLSNLEEFQGNPVFPQPEE